jgi:hypothetical protein
MAKRGPAKRPAISENTLLWLAIFFLLFAVLAVMAYYKQVDEARQLIRFRQQQSERQLKVLPTPTPTPKTRAR